MMHWLLPNSAVGFILRFALLIGWAGTANAIFGQFVVKDIDSIVTYYLTHAILVSGPLIGLFLTVATLQVRLQRRLWRLSRQDELTKLYNRRTFFEITAKRRAKNTSGVLMMVDADWFKTINDSHGHQVGDKCLQSIAYTLQRNMRQEDVIGRIGGEEFAIYLPQTTLQHVRVIGERLTKPIPYHSQDNKHLTVTLSIGVVIAHHDKTLDEMLARADMALYRAKIGGRAQMVFWDEDWQDTHRAKSNAAVTQNAM